MHKVDIISVQFLKEEKENEGKNRVESRFTIATVYFLCSAIREKGWTAFSLFQHNSILSRSCCFSFTDFVITALLRRSIRRLTCTYLNIFYTA